MEWGHSEGSSILVPAFIPLLLASLEDKKAAIVGVCVCVGVLLCGLGRVVGSWSRRKNKNGCAVSRFVFCCPFVANVEEKVEKVARMKLVFLLVLVVSGK